MSKFLKNSELTFEKAKQIVDDTLQSCDDGELYLEDTKSETIIFPNGSIFALNAEEFSSSTR